MGVTLATMRRLLIVLVACLALAPAPARAASLTWEQWKAIPGALDVDGPRSDGSLIVAGSAALYLVNPAGSVTPFARGPGGYHEDPGLEAYLAVSNGGHVSAANCDFVRDETFVLRMHFPIGVNRVSASGDDSGSFANLPGVTMLTGITFDTVGAFDHRLLVMGVTGSKGVIFAVDCNGAVQVITRSAPALEGGLSVAPNGFGTFGGDLIVPDEITGSVNAIAPDGRTMVVMKHALPAGLGVTLGAVGFVPPGFMSRGGAVYHADHKTPHSSFPGTDTVLRLTSAQLGAAGVQDGDLLAATESGAGLIAMHCTAACTVITMIEPAHAHHGEGHIAFTVMPALSSPAPSPRLNTPGSNSPASVSPLTIGIAAGAVALIVVAALIARRRRRR